ncbi:MAG: endonuclease/exonuclease/phosphatase family protein [Prevotella sp.]|nr:endonuclease/exonuclease/phosphatase family protein [Prevotella sp.]
MVLRLHLLLLSLLLLSAGQAAAQPLTFVEFNCENLFDTRHDSLKHDEEYLPEATRHWTGRRYWRKQNHLAQAILSCGDDVIPSLVALCEVENDSVLRDLTSRSLLRAAGYRYFVTDSPDQRGIDVALLYNPLAFMPLCHHALRVPLVEGMRPTRDILYVSGRIASGDTLHVFVVHAPSRFGGERHSRPFRQQVAGRLCQALDSLHRVVSQPHIIVAGDFNDPAGAPALQQLARHGLTNLSAAAHGPRGVRGTYRFQGRWESIDHLFGSPAVSRRVDTVFIHAPAFLLEEETRFGGFRPRRTYHGFRYQPGYSDHLPLVLRLTLK